MWRPTMTKQEIDEDWVLLRWLAEYQLRVSIQLALLIAALLIGIWIAP